MINVFSLWDVLADQAIGVFVEAPLPRVSAIVVGQGENPSLIGLQVITDRIRDSPRCFIDRGFIKMTEAPKCGCGRSPTGNCIGWHALSEEEYQEKKTAYETLQAQKS
jgi:hypothetical protein